MDSIPRDNDTPCLQSAEIYKFDTQGKQVPDRHSTLVCSTRGKMIKF
jgi:hypothetical protein